MNVRFLAGVAASGALIGLLSSVGIAAERWELGFWLVAGVGWVTAANRVLESDVFRHMTLGGAAAGFLAADVKILLWSKYLEHHPQVSSYIAENGDAGIKTSLLFSGLVSGLAFGMMLGGPMAWRRLRQQQHEESMVRLASESEE